MLQTDHLKRTHDYEPFVRAYIRTLAEEGLLSDLMENLPESSGAATNGKGKKGAARGKGRGRGRGRGRGKK